MGGNVFPQAKRMESKNEFYSSANKQNALFYSLGFNCRIPKQIGDKQSFGDIDLIIPTGHTNAIREILDNNNLVHKTNGIVLSYLSEDNHQIDLIQINPDNIAYAHAYFSNGDSGNILGRIIKNQFHLKNGFNGLYYVFRRDSDSYSKDFLLSLEYGKILDILELDKQQYHKGFDSNKQLFDWIYQCPYLDTDIFQLENLNNTNRVRDRKRKFYNEWLTYLAGKPKKPLKSPVALSHYFPDFDAKYQAEEKQYQAIKNYKNKFNGGMVMALTGLTGKPLGDFMKKINAQYSREQITAMSDDVLKQIILDQLQEG